MIYLLMRTYVFVSQPALAGLLDMDIKNKSVHLIGLIGQDIWKLGRKMD